MPVDNQKINEMTLDATGDEKVHKKPFSGEWLLLHCLGFGTCWGWVHVAFSSTVLCGVMPESLSLSIWILNVLSNGLAMVMLGLFSAFRTSRTFRGLEPLFAVLTVIGTIGFLFGQSLSVMWVYAAAVLSGFGTAGLMLLWAEAYRDIPPTLAKQRTIPASVATVFYTICSSACFLIWSALLPLCCCL